MSGLYDRIFASGYDRFLDAAERAGLAERREHLLAQAAGRVLEIGAGTGLNLRYYKPAVTRLVLSEPSEAMVAQLRPKLGDAPVEPEVIVAGAEQLPFENASFDCVVSTLVLCTVPEPDAALAEIHRVLAPGGRLLLLEHVRSEDQGSAKWQDRFETPWRWWGNGCRCNRDTATAVRSAGFEFAQLDAGEFPKAPPIVRPLIEGIATVVPSAA
jgi:ubiquinone/menaquinone biosynthesis C-methylase UbiE